MLGLLAAVPIRFWAIGAAILGIFLWGSSGYIKANYSKKKLDEYTAAQKANELKATQEARKIEQVKNASNAKVGRDFNASKANRTVLTDIGAVASSVRAEARSSGSAASANSAAVCGIDGSRGRILERVFAESTELVEEGAGRVKDLSDQVTALQQYASTVCTK